LKNIRRRVSHTEKGTLAKRIKIKSNSKYQSGRLFGIFKLY